MFAPVLILCLLGMTLGEDWDYDDQEEWPGLCTTGKSQSPISIITSKLKDELPDEIESVGYDKAYDFIMKNTGRNVTLAQKSGEKPIIRGRPLGSDYIFDGVYFHWNSEHAIDNIRYDLEAHFVHYNSKYGSFSEALKQEKGVAIVAVLYKISQEGNKNFDKLVKGVSEVREVSATSEIKDFTLSSIFPANFKAYYLYMGSMTYPGCEEGVVWIVVQNQAPISKEQVNEFTEVKGNEIKSNYREVQPLNDRSVYFHNDK